MLLAGEQCAIELVRVDYISAAVIVRNPMKIVTRSPLFLALLFVQGHLVLADDVNISSQYAALQADSEADAGDWYQLAITAREAGIPDIAEKSVAAAADAGFSPVRVGIERARQHVTAGRRNAAVTELQELADGGFTAVGVFLADPVVNSLAGYGAYDSLVAAMSVQAYPCSHQKSFHDFDFWIGEWDVHVANGTLAGTNSIRAEERGCVLVERWRASSGGTGMSINYHDVPSGQWVQSWHAEGGTQINIRGGLTDEGMLLVGEIHYVGNGTTAPFRGLWTPLPDGRVRQFFEQSNDGGETWTPWFEGFYSRKTSAE